MSCSTTIFAIDAANKVLIIDHIEHLQDTATGRLTEAGREQLARVANLAKYL